MKRNLLFVVLAILMIVSCVIGLSGCDLFGEETVHQHQMQRVDAVTATCTEDGNTEYWACSTCGKYFSDAEGKSEIIDLNSTVIPAGHIYENGVCSVCGALKTSFGLSFALNDDEASYSVLDIGSCSDTDIVIPFEYNDLPVTSIFGRAFEDCHSIKSVIIGNSVTSIGDAAFQGCSLLKSITIGNNVTYIGSSAFYNCKSLTSITIPDSVMSIEFETFYGCSSLTNVTISNSVTSIGDGAFLGCCSLTNITIGNGVTSIEDRAFSGCCSLTSITIGNGVTSIGRYAFYDTAYYNDLKNWTNGVLYIGNHLIEAKASLTGEYTIKEGTLTIANFAFVGCNNLTNITIPESVTSIGWGAFEGCSSIESITIPDSVTSIGWGAFESCNSLTSITVPFVGENKDGTENTYFGYIFGAWSNFDNDDHVPTSLHTVIITGGASIGEYAFYDCSSLTSIIIPESVTSIGYRAFDCCSSLKNIAFGENSQLTSIGDDAFYNCSMLTSISIPDSVTSIGEYAFYGCSSLKNITFGENSQLTNIEDYAFYNCSLLTSITIGKEVKSIGDYAFPGNSLTSIFYRGDISKWCSISGLDNLDKSKVYIGNLKLQEMTNITISDGVTTIENEAFYGCGLLTSISIPDSVTSIGVYAFSGCSSLKSVYYRGDISKWCSISGLDNLDKSKVYIGNLKLQEMTNITISDGVTTIENEAFYGCGLLTSISIPDSVTSIGDYAFSGCSSLKSIIIPDSVTSIGDGAFRDCSLFTSITIGNGVTSIGDDAFYNCSMLTSISIPDSVTSIGYQAFYGCSSLTEIDVTASNGYYCLQDGVLFNKDKTTLICYPAGMQATNYIIPDVVTSIGDYAFSGCSSLKSINIPDCVKSIGYRAFEDCSSLTSVTIGNGVTSIGSYAFYNTAYYNDLKNWTNGVLYIGNHLIEAKASLTGEYTIKEGTLTIANFAFVGCNNLTNITIPESVTSIGWGAFESCNSLTSITVPFVGENKDGTENTYFGYIFGAWSNFDNDGYVPTSLHTVIIAGGASIGEYAFYDCSSLASIIIPESVTSIGKYAFYDCGSLASIIIPDSVTSIGDNAFAWCSSLTSISIGNGVKSIREGAFNNTAYYNDLKNWTNGVLYIGNYVIYAKPSLTGEYTIKEGTLTIADFAFVDCNNLTNITIPESVTSIGDWAFSGCSSLGSLIIPDSVISIGNFTFYGCTALTSITIPDSVISIGDSEFESCSVLTSIYYNGTMEQWNAIDKGERWNFYTGNYTIVCSDGNISKN